MLLLLLLLFVRVWRLEKSPIKDNEIDDFSRSEHLDRLLGGCNNSNGGSDRNLSVLIPWIETHICILLLCNTFLLLFLLFCTSVVDVVMVIACLHMMIPELAQEQSGTRQAQLSKYCRRFD